MLPMKKKSYIKGGKRERERRADRIGAVVCPPPPLPLPLETLQARVDSRVTYGVRKEGNARRGYIGPEDGRDAECAWLTSRACEGTGERDRAESPAALGPFFFLHEEVEEVEEEGSTRVEHQREGFRWGKKEFHGRRAGEKNSRLHAILPERRSARSKRRSYIHTTLPFYITAVGYTALCSRLGGGGVGPESLGALRFRRTNEPDRSEGTLGSGCRRRCVPPVTLSSRSSLDRGSISRSAARIFARSPGAPRSSRRVHYGRSAAAREQAAG